jgi:hypothetical protein
VWVAPDDPGWVEVEAAEMEVDRIAEALAVAESSRGVLHPLDLGVDALGACVGNALITAVRTSPLDRLD